MSIPAETGSPVHINYEADAPATAAADYTGVLSPAAPTAVDLPKRTVGQGPQTWTPQYTTVPVSPEVGQAVYDQLAPTAPETVQLPRSYSPTS